MLTRVLMALVVLLSCVSWGSPALSAGPKKLVLDYDFTFDFYGAQIFPWSSGGRQGLVTDIKGDMATALESAILSCERYLDASIYGVSNQQWFIDSLEECKDSGARVRGTVDQLRGERGDWDPQNFTYKDTVELANILDNDSLVPDVGPTGRPRSGSILHNKFIVIDRKMLWTGSTNLSHTGMGSEYNANISILIKSPHVARLFANEFYQMHSKERFSVYKRPRSQRKSFEFKDGTNFEVFFSPQDDPIDRAIVPFIQNAKSTLDIGMFFLTDMRVANALISAADRGVKVRLIYDALAASHRSSLHSYLENGGISVRVENWGGKMHMKSAVADGRNVVLGSMNWSLSGDRINDENTIVVRSNRSLGMKLQRYFDRLWQTLDERYFQLKPGTPRAEGYESKNSCFDGIDNDHDGLIDQRDPACA